jgi:hypothetical protein
MFVAMLYGAKHPERLTAARRALMSDTPFGIPDKRLLYVLSLFVVSMCVWGWYLTRDWLPIVFASISICLCIVVTVASRGGFGRLAGRHVPVRLIGLVGIGMAVEVWDARQPLFSVVAALIGVTALFFPKTYAHLSHLGMTEQQEIAVTRSTGVIGSVIAALIVVGLTYMTVRHHLDVR